jgi:hypothetical protein
VSGELFTLLEGSFPDFIDGFVASAEEALQEEEVLYCSEHSLSPPLTPLSFVTIHSKSIKLWALFSINSLPFKGTSCSRLCLAHPGSHPMDITFTQCEESNFHQLDTPSRLHLHSEREFSSHILISNYRAVVL